MVKHLIVSVYKENINWLNSINCFDKIFIYNKGDRIIDNSIILPNVGREAHTYVHHIVTNYFNLADFTVFLQGHPFDAMEGINEFNINEKFLSHVYNPNKHEPVFRQNLFHDGTGLTARCYQEYFNGTVPPIMFSPGAQWFVPKQNILSKSITFYKDILEKLSVHRTHNADGIVNAWNMEGLWNYVFDKNVTEKNC